MAKGQEPPNITGGSDSKPADADKPLGRRRRDGARATRKIDLKRRTRLTKLSQRPRPLVPPPDPVLAELDELMQTPLGRLWLSDGLAESVDLSGAGKEPGVVSPMPRRQVIGTGSDAIEFAPPMAEEVAFRAGWFGTVGRLLLQLFGMLRYFGGTFFDAMLGRNRVERRAIRLRKVLESLGPTSIKLGQQLSVRADILPYAYCAELWKIRDSAPAFESKLALQAIERHSGQSVTDTFALFDPEPVWSSSIACVYQAMLADGQKVAVKIRRPGIGAKLAAELRAFEWLLQIAEMLSVVRVGTSRNLISGLRTLVLEELDFKREARYTALFRDRAAKRKKRWISSPTVFRDLSNDEVLVTEYISGVFLSEILAATEQGDGETLELIRGAGIDEKTIARRLAELFNWELIDSLLFHADPHPDNIVCRPGNEIVLLDFGACGQFSSKTRRLWDQLHSYMAKEDVQGMVECSIAMIEPPPPIDLDRYRREVESLYWESLYATKDATSQWWEKARGVLWLKFADLGRKHHVPINLDTLRLFRATFLYDAVMFRLHRKLKIDAEYQRYQRKSARRAKRRVMRSIRKRIQNGPSDADYLGAEELVRQSSQFLARVQRGLDNPQHSFTHMVGKAAYGAAVTLRVTTAAIIVHMLAITVVFIDRKLSGEPFNVWDALVWIVSRESYQVAVLVVGLVVIRKALTRVEAVDVE